MGNIPVNIAIVTGTGQRTGGPGDNSYTNGFANPFGTIWFNDLTGAMSIYATSTSTSTPTPTPTPTTTPSSTPAPTTLSTFGNTAIGTLQRPKRPKRSIRLIFQNNKYRISNRHNSIHLRCIFWKSHSSTVRSKRKLTKHTTGTIQRRKHRHNFFMGRLQTHSILHSNLRHTLRTRNNGQCPIKSGYSSETQNALAVQDMDPMQTALLIRLEPFGLTT